MTDDRSHAHRRRVAVEGVRKLREGILDDVEGYLQHSEDRMGAVGSFSVDFVFGDIWARPQLSRRDRSLVTLAALIAGSGAERELAVHAESAIIHGLSPEEVEEVVTHLSAYAGFPRALAALRHIQAGLDAADSGSPPPPRQPAQRKSDAERRRDGIDVLSTLMGWSDPEADLAHLRERLGPMADVSIQFLCGEVWARPQLSPRDRSLATLSALALLGRTDHLPTHVRGALNHGLTREEIEEVMVHLLVYAGWPLAVTAFQVVREIFAEIDKSE